MSENGCTMKKVLFVAVLIALIGGSVFGAISTANAAKAIPMPTPTARSANTLQIALLRWYEANQSDITYPAGALTPWGICFDGANIWVTDARYDSRTVSKLRASDGASLGTYTVGTGPQGVCFDGANIWVTNSGDNTVSKLSSTLTPNTPVGSNVCVSLSCGSVVFNTVSAEGFTTCTSQQGNPAGGIPSGFRVRGLFIDITTTAAYSGPVTVCITYDPSIPNPQNLRLFHWNAPNWEDVTTSIDPATNTICGQVSGLSPFFVGEEVAQTGGGGCFIATAAYGSYLDSHVQTLRDFRDSYMVTNPIGQSFVSTYYRLSPPIAEFIDDHPALKPVVRVGLLPAIVFSSVAINTTPMEKIAIASSLAFVCILVFVGLRRKIIRGKF